jgi:hypothetical protein
MNDKLCFVNYSYDTLNNHLDTFFKFPKCPIHHDELKVNVIKKYLPLHQDKKKEEIYHWVLLHIGQLVYDPSMLRLVSIIGTLNMT